jgi:hypothetical protein
MSQSHTRVHYLRHPAQFGNKNLLIPVIPLDDLCLTYIILTMRRVPIHKALVGSESPQDRDGRSQLEFRFVQRQSEKFQRIQIH